MPKTNPTSKLLESLDPAVVSMLKLINDVLYSWKILRGIKFNPNPNTNTNPRSHGGPMVVL